MNKIPSHILIRDYTYVLPPDKIALFPLATRDESKLLVYRNGTITDASFRQLPELLPHGCTLVLNDTRVIQARLLFTKPTGGVIEIFCLEPYGQSMEESLHAEGKVQWKCLIGGASKWKSGQVLFMEIMLGDRKAILSAKYVEKEEDSFIIGFEWTPECHAFAEVIHAAGAIPLPPYIRRSAIEIDSERYQTIFAKEEGSVAAPTAALHFTEKVFEHLADKRISMAFVTLHVGAGTFKPVKTESIAEHLMHSETFTVSKKTIEKLLHSQTIIAVGTTSLRTLESLHWLGVKLINGLIKDDWELHQWEAYELNGAINRTESLRAILTLMNNRNLEQLHCRTSLIIVPGYDFKIPAGLVTNFHQPQSTLLLLVAAFVGADWKKIYEHALQNDYRFLSYGDSSLLMRGASGEW